MKELKNYIRESLLDDEDELIKKEVPTVHLYKQLSFLKKFLDQIKFNIVERRQKNSYFKFLPGIILSKKSHKRGLSADAMNRYFKDYDKQTTTALNKIKHEYEAKIESKLTYNTTYEFEGENQVPKKICVHSHIVNIGNSKSYIEITVCGDSIGINIYDYECSYERARDIFNDFIESECKNIIDKN